MIAYVDMVSGIAGDMALGAFIDLGVPVTFLEEKLGAFLTGFSLRTEEVYRHHLRAVNLYVDVDEKVTSRHYTDIRQMIEKAPASEWVKQKSLKAFEKIARAESKIHGIDIEKVHFHEIGAIDSIVDIVGTFLCVEYLNMKTVVASKVPLGSGFVECDHGRIPVPVPATVAILKDTPVTSSDATTEIVTPTGAAIITTLASDFGTMPDMRIVKTGYGAGKRETGASAPNLLRVILGRPDDESGADVVVIKTNIDDLNPEVLGFVMENLLEQGALDVCHVPVQMKKNRPGVQLEVICRKEKLDALSDLILAQTSALGVRYHECKRKVLERQVVSVKTSFGKVRVKRIIAPDQSIRYAPEFEVCKKIALENDIPLREVYDRIRFDVRSLDRD